MSAAQPAPTIEHMKKIASRWFDEVWNHGRRETIYELFPAGAVIHDGSRDIVGPDEFVKFYEALHDRFSHFNIVPILSFAEGNLVCQHWVATFSDKASGKPVKITGTSVVRIENGVFAEGWQNWDALGVETQLADSAASA
ncbi:MAG TPA: nuclear transport factor 2 family protein [Candidatus Acidoferrales bacterium]